MDGRASAEKATRLDPPPDIPRSEPDSVSANDSSVGQPAPSAPSEGGARAGTVVVHYSVGQRMRDLTAPLKLSLVLENRGNVARDHLASERTFLAYVRTSLGCASAGVSLVQLFMLSITNDVSMPRNGVYLGTIVRVLGAAIVLVGLVMLIFGLVRYFSTQSALIRGHFPVARRSITAMALMLVLLVGIVFGVIVTGTQHN